MPEVRKKDIEREIKRIRDAIKRDPEKYGALQMLLNRYDPAYDPEKEPEPGSGSGAGNK